MTADETDPRAGVLPRAARSIGVFFLLLAAVLFLPAGLGWRRGLALFIVFLVLTAPSAAYLWRKNPDIFVARGRIHRGTKPWDKVLLGILLTSFAAIFAVAAFDVRCGWSAVPVLLVVPGYAMISLAFTVSTWAYTVNKFAEPSVRIQSDRGQVVIHTGPYAIVRHPLYVASVLLTGGIPLALGSWWAFIPAGVWTVLIIVRTALEDRLLRNELVGYQAYASRVRYRLVPGLW